MNLFIIFPVAILWERNGSTSGPTPWQIYHDDDEFSLLSELIIVHGNKSYVIRKLINILIFYKKEIIYKSIYITLHFRCTKFETHYLRRAAKLISGEAAPFAKLLYTFEPIST
jgi:hypothetical protein